MERFICHVVTQQRVVEEESGGRKWDVGGDQLKNWRKSYIKTIRHTLKCHIENYFEDCVGIFLSAPFTLWAAHIY